MLECGMEEGEAGRNAECGVEESLVRIGIGRLRTGVSALLMVEFATVIDRRYRTRLMERRSAAGFLDLAVS
jgi:hypothetical protein